MAWTCSGATNRALIENLAKNGLIKSARVQAAMDHVDRAHYAPHDAYRDEPQPIGHGATISAPHMHASACESLLDHLSPGSRVLDVGSGSGYLTHVLATLVEPGGVVVGIDQIQPLVDLARSNTSKSEHGRRCLHQGTIEFILGDGRSGSPSTGVAGSDSGLFDAIHVGAASDGIPPALVDQLKAPGRMFIPVQDEDSLQHVYIVDKHADGTVVKRKGYGVRYVPLTDAPKG